jgi:signal transduction histidine kinase/CheY-like chemotaxis protein
MTFSDPFKACIRQVRRLPIFYRLSLGFAISLLIPSLLLAWNAFNNYEALADSDRILYQRIAKEVIAPSAAIAIRLGRTDQLEPMLSNYLRIKTAVAVTVLDQKNEIFIRVPTTDIAINDYKSFKTPVVYRGLTLNSDIEYDEATLKNDAEVVGYLVIHLKDQEKAAFFALLKDQFFIIIASIIICIIIAILLTASITSPLRRLMYVIKTGVYDRSEHLDMLEDNHSDELSDLYKILFASNETLQKNQDQIKQVNRELTQSATQLEDQIKQTQFAKRELEESNDRKDQFISNFSHEIKSPLTTIGASIDFLKEETSGLWNKMGPYLTTDQAPIIKGIMKDVSNIDTCIRMLDDSTERMSNLVEEVSFSVLDIMPDEPFEITTISLVDSVNKVIEYHKATIDDKGLSLFTSIDIPKDITVETDWPRTEKSIRSVISNAINFTSHGSITITAYLKSDEHTTRLILDVEDTGPGIPQKASHRIFDRFYILEDPSIKSGAGIGVGLANARSLINSIGGKLYLKESHINKGSTFRFDIPYSTTANELTGPQTVKLPGNIRILHVEDSRMHRHVFNLYSKIYKLNITAAASAKEALELLGKHEFDVIVADCHMPIMSGQEFAKIVRSREVAGQQVPTYLVALTADDSQKNYQDCMSSGFNTFYTKPFRREKFDRLIKEIASFLTLESTLP